MERTNQQLHFETRSNTMDDTLLTWFSAIEHQPWSFLLRSSAQDHPNNRWDILVADPIATLETYGQKTIVTHPDGTQTTHESDPFALINELTLRYLPHHSPHQNLPFIGGALGYFAYDLGRRIEAIPTQAINELNTPDMAIGLYDWAILLDHHTQELTVVQPQSADRLTWLAQQQPQNPESFALTSEWHANMTPSTYHNKFNQIQHYLKSGDCYQINLAQRFCADYSGSEWQAFLTLEQNNGAPFSAFLRLPNSAILSVSPERFLSCWDNRIETKPIKGTRPRHQDPEQDQRMANELQQAPKDRAENVMIVDLLRNDIGRIAQPGSVKVPHLFAVESFPAVHHLVSTITGELPSKHSPTELLRACFPGGSITGAPKVRAMEIIEELEPHRRHVYCGSIGYISRCGRMDTNITIRTLLACQQKLHVWAGGGIVADSKFEEEYQETLDKVGKILPLLSYGFNIELT